MSGTKSRTRSRGRLAVRSVLAAALVAIAAPVLVASAEDPVLCVTAATEASVTVENASVVLGGTVRVTGAGWCHPNDGGSVIAVKIDDGAISRPDASLHANTSIWAIVEADPADGTFTADIELPDGTETTSDPVLVTGEHTLRFLSGSLKLGDLPRSVLSDPIAVTAPADEEPPGEEPPGEEPPGEEPPGEEPPGEEPPEEEPPSEEPPGEEPPAEEPPDDEPPAEEPPGEEPPAEPGCVPTSAAPTVSVTPASAVFGGTLNVSGEGWCHPGDGGSVIALKIDDGAYERLDASLHANTTIWAIVEADPADGTFALTIDLPDGTTATSVPALPEGSHTIRLLTGSLKLGDAVRTLQSEPFTVGTYRPNGTPTLLDEQALTPANAGGVTAATTASEVVVTVPSRRPGNWVFVTAYLPDGSPRYPWDATWFQLGGGSSLRLPRDAVTFTGTAKLAVQSGGQNEFGGLLGWAPVTFPGTGGTGTGSTGTGSSGTGGTTTAAGSKAAAGATTTRGAGTGQASAAPARVAPAVLPGAELVALPTRGATGATQDGVLALHLPSAAPGAVVYLRVYAGNEVVDLGWVALDETATARLDLGLLAPGDVRVTAQDEAGVLAGWVQTTVGPVSEPAAAPVAESAPAPGRDRAGGGIPVGPADVALLCLGAAALTGTGLLLRTRRKVVPA